MADTSIEIQANIGHYFKQGLINPEVAQRIWEVEEISAWFEHFKRGDLSLEIKPKT